MMNPFAFHRRVRNVFRFSTSTLLMAGIATIVLRGDVIELGNGDRIHGSVLGVDDETVRVRSEIQGDLALPRKHVTLIRFGTAPAAGTPQAAARPDASGLPGATPAPAANLDADAALTPQLSGLDPRTIEMVQRQFLSSAGPEANQQFNEMVSGLLGGKLGVQDIRLRAQESVEQLKQAKGDLGDDAGELLDGYLRILEGFLDQTAPATRR